MTKRALQHTCPGIVISRERRTNPVNQVWFQCAMSSGMAFYAYICAASLHHCHVHGGRNTASPAAALRLSYQTQAMRTIKEAVARLDGPASDTMVYSILILAVHGPRNNPFLNPLYNTFPLATAQYLYFCGGLTFVTEHLRAAYYLVDLKGGLEAIELYALRIRLYCKCHTPIPCRRLIFERGSSCIPHFMWSVFSDSNVAHSGSCGAGQDMEFGVEQQQ